MTPAEAFERYVQGAFRVEGDAVYLSDRNEELYNAFLQGLEGVDSIDALIPLLTLKYKAARDVRLELWLPVLQRIRHLAGNDRDAALAEVFVLLVYGEDEEAEMAWGEVRQLYPVDPEVLRLGLVVGLTMRDEETVQRCLADLPESPENARIQFALDEGDWEGMNRLVHYDPHRLEWFRRASDLLKEGK